MCACLQKQTTMKLTLTRRKHLLQAVYVRKKYMSKTLGIKEGGGCLINESTLLGAYDTYIVSSLEVGSQT